MNISREKGKCNTTCSLINTAPTSELQFPAIFIYSRRSFTIRRDKANMDRAADEKGEPIPTSAVLMSASKHIAANCRAENRAFLNCKKKDQNPKNCLHQGREVTRCVLTLLKDLHQRCTKEMDGYVGCMYYHTNEFDLCRKEQEEFEKACPWNQ